jgi:hypothetical protein
MTMHVTQLESNFATPDGREHTFILGRLTLVVGRNGSGKTSAITHPLRLATAGSTDGLSGRDAVKDAARLANYLPAGASNLGVTLTFDTQDSKGRPLQAAWGLRREADGTVRRALPEPAPGVDPARCLPLRQVKELLRGDEEIARRTLLRWAVKSATPEDVLATIPAHLHAKFRDINDKMPGAPAERLSAVLDYVRTRISELRTQADAQDATVSALSQQLHASTSPEQVEAAKKLLDDWSAALVRAHTWETLSRQRASLVEAEQRRDEAAAGVAAWRDRRLALAATRPETPVQNPEAARHQAAAVALGTGSEPSCFACGQSSPHIAAWREHHAKLGAPPESTAHDAWLAEDAAAGTALGAWEATLRTTQALVESLRAALSANAVDPGVTVTAAQAAVDGARQHHDALSRAAGAVDAIAVAQDAASQVRASIPVYEDLLSACKTAVAKLLDTGLDEFRARVQTYVADPWQFALRVQDENGNPTLEIGFVNADGSIRTNLSGAETDMLAVALAMTIAASGDVTEVRKTTKGRPSSTPRRLKPSDVSGYYLIIPDDTQRDPETLAGLLRAWSKFPGQVVVESTCMPKGRISKDWTIVNMDEVFPDRARGPRSSENVGDGGTDSEENPEADREETSGGDEAGDENELPWRVRLPGDDPEDAGARNEVSVQETHEEPVVEPLANGAADIAAGTTTAGAAGIAGAGDDDTRKLRIDLGYPEAVIERLEPETRAHVLREDVAFANTQVMGASLIVRQPGKKKPVASLALKPE